MNTKRLFLSFLSISLFLLCNQAFGQDYTVTLVCDTAELLDGMEEHKACYIAESPDTDPRDFTITVNVGDTILWNGEGASDGQTLLIKHIKFEKGTNIFNKRELDGETTVEGKVKHNTKDKPDYKYKIKFKITESGKMYKIDPKVRVNP